ncbi:hypothetical protein ABMA28_012633 [Loxostege sticticalis]|uniref:PH domain-containing protein n=1 Tax=Loxostege sticticalis TaxID=481309 RepID=A0ABD0S4H6_LOXSC
MSYGHDEGPVYYREIQKNAYLKRIPNESSGSKLRPLGHKKPPLKPMWTLFCVHNGRSPYLEQYPLAESPATLSHKPVWRACLRTARHVTASVKPHSGLEYDFLVDTDHGPVRMIAPDWESMQDWVTTLRNKLHELRILSKGENVYCAAPAAPPPRAAARDPTSPLPPTPPAPPDSWDETPSLPSTSQETEPKKSVAKICGQNICLDDSILKRNVDTTDSDEEFFNEIDSDRQATNITVIQVSNKPPHTAIPVLGPETDVFDFNFTQNVTDDTETSFVNIVNTEVNVNCQQTENGYGTVFSNDSEYGHLSLTTTVNLTDDSVKVTDKDGVYERLCMASTSNEATVSRLKRLERVRKSSLPNLEVTSNSESTYEYLYPSQNQDGDRNARVTVNNESQNGRVEVNSNSNGVTSENAVTVGGNVSFNTRAVRSNVERSHSQNAYDSSPRSRENLRRVQNLSPKRDGRNDKTESTQAKPIWKRGLTELSLLTRLRGIGQRRHSPSGHDQDTDRSGTVPVKVVHRSRPEARVDSTRRRSSSLSNGQSPPTQSPAAALVPLRVRQARILQAEQRRRCAVPAAAPQHTPPALAHHDAQLWIAWWPVGGSRCNGRAGDRLAAVRGTQPRDLHHARQLFKTSPTPIVDILFHRVPLAKIYVLNKRDHESIGIKLDGECNIVSVEAGSPAARAGLPPPGKWAVTEVNNRPLNLLKGGEEEMNRISLHGTEVSVLIQPSALVKKLRAAIKANKNLLSIR